MPHVGALVLALLALAAGLVLALVLPGGMVPLKLAVPLLAGAAFLMGRAARARTGPPEKPPAPAEPDPDELSPPEVSEQWFRAIFRLATAGLVRCAPNGRFLQINRRFSELVGRPREDLLKLRDRDVTHPDDRPASQALLGRLAAGGPDFAFQKRFLRPDGTETWGHCCVSAVRSPTGEVECLLAIVLDITAQKRAEQGRAFLAEATRALAGSLDYVATLKIVARLSVPTIADLCAVDVCTPDGSVRRVAVEHGDPAQVARLENMVRRYPFDPQWEGGVAQVLRTGQELLYPEIGDELLARFARDADQLAILRELGLRSVMLVPMVARGRSLGAITLAITGSQRTYGADDLALARELADRCALAVDNARLFQEAQENEARYRTLAESLPHLAWTCQPDGSCDYLSRQWCAYTGLREVQGLGRGWLSAIHPDDRSHVRQRWQAAVAGTGEYALEYRLRRADGEYRWFQVRAAPLADETGQVLKWFGSCADITEQKRAEQELREAARRKDDFLALLAHELRNPLAPIRNAARVLRLRAVGDPDQVEAAALSERQVAHMSRLLDDLLDVSRISRGKVHLRPEHCDLVAIVRDTAQDYRGPLEAAGLELFVQLPDHPLWIHGDPTRLIQIVGNLLHNAGKFTDPGGRVEVSLTATEDLRQAAIAVRDTGIGLDAEALRQLFEPFSQPGRPDSHGGLGLGLALVKGLSELHGGSAAADSEGPGRGTMFTVRLPLAADQEAESGLEAPASATESRRRVLVIEDNRDGAASLRLLLTVFGHDVELAYSGSEGLEAARRSRPDAIICDIGLPGEPDGHEVGRALRADPELGQALLIALTGYGHPEAQERSREAGFDAHLTKPVDPDELRRLLAGAPV